MLAVLSTRANALGTMDWERLRRSPEGAVRVWVRSFVRLRNLGEGNAALTLWLSTIIQGGLR